jgi:chlorophyll synthase
VNDPKQLLGIKGASETSSIWKLRIQLMKPITWIPLIWGVICGAAASGNFEWTFSNVLASLACMLMSGPLLAGYTQTINDFFDKEIDAINEPNRPIPSGKISIKDVKIQIWVLLIAGLIVAFLLDLYAKHSFPSVLLLALGGSFVSYIYSAPPLKLKQNGWLGNYALGASYIALPWWAGQALFGKLTIVTAILTLAYSLSGLGIAVINDFKSVEGDSKLGLNSLPVVFGIKNASRISAGLIDIFQLAMVVVLVSIGQHLASVILVLLVIPQITFQDMWLLRDPLKFDVKYQASAQPFLITGMLVTALAIGHSFLVA